MRKAYLVLNCPYHWTYDFEPYFKVLRAKSVMEKDVFVEILIEIIDSNIKERRRFISNY